MTAALQAFVGRALSVSAPLEITPMRGGGSCDVFAVDADEHHWVLRRAPRHASSSTAHDVLREFQVLTAVLGTGGVPIATPRAACEDPAVFDGVFYLMDRVDGVPIVSGLPAAWAGSPQSHRSILEQLVDTLVAIHAVDWAGAGLRSRAADGDYLRRQVARWSEQLASYGGRALPAADEVADWLARHRPADQPLTLTHGDYKLDNVLVSRDLPARLLAVVDWEMASVGDPLVDLAWSLIFHPGPEGTLRLGMTTPPTFDVRAVPTVGALVDRYAAATGRDVSVIGWYHVFARWKLAIVLEGSYAKFLRGESTKAIHQYFGAQADLLLASALTLTGAEPGRSPS